MTQNGIIRMAKEVGFVEDTNCEIYGSYYHLERFAAIVAAHERERAWTEKDWGEAAEWIRQQEREACAKVCEKAMIQMNYSEAPYKQCAAAIRARGEK